MAERSHAIGNLRGEIAAKGDIERRVGACHAGMSPRGGGALNGARALQCIAVELKAVAPAVEMEGAGDKVGGDGLRGWEEKKLAGRVLLTATVGAARLGGWRGDRSSPRRIQGVLPVLCGLGGRVGPADPDSATACSGVT